MPLPAGEERREISFAIEAALPESVKIEWSGWVQEE